jgi:hypothetical protein
LWLPLFLASTPWLLPPFYIVSKLNNNGIKKY